MTRQLWAEGAAALSTAAGVDVLRVVASTAQPRATAAASHLVERKVRRIGCPFSPSSGEFWLNLLIGRKRFRNGYHVDTKEVKAFAGKWAQIRGKEFRDVPEHASMHRCPRPLSNV